MNEQEKGPQLGLINIRIFIERIRGGLDNQTKAISEQTKAIQEQTEALTKAYHLASIAGPWVKGAVVIAGIALTVQITEHLVKLF